MSVLRRGALGNGHESTLRFAFALLPTLDHSITVLATIARSHQLFSDVSHAMGLEQAAINMVAYRRSGAGRQDPLLWNGLEIGIGDVDFRTERICIHCYAEQGFCLSDWDHVGAAACARHHRVLLAACPCCQAPFSYLHDPLQCGCSLEAMCDKAPSCAPESAALLRRLIDTGDSRGLQLLSQIHRMLEWWRRLGIHARTPRKPEVIFDVHRGAWPDFDGIRELGGTVRIHPRVALAPLLAHADLHVREHGQALLTKHGAPLWQVHGLEAAWSASTAMAVLGIGRVPFQKLLEHRQLIPGADDRVTAQQINDLLWRVNPHWGDPVVTADVVRLRGGQHRISLARLLESNGAEASSAARAALKCAPAHPASPHVILIPQAASQLRTNTESVRGAIRTGLLPATKGSPASAVQWCIRSEDLNRFDAEYIFASALLGQRAGRTTVSSRLRSAGISPVSGPGIDSGVTFLFRRRDLRAVQLDKLLRCPYQSPAGRRMRLNVPDRAESLTAQETAEQLGVPAATLRRLVDQKWIGPVARAPGRKQMFRAPDVSALLRTVREGYVDLALAAEITRQTENEFRRTWLDSGFAAVRTFGHRQLIEKAQLDRVTELWTGARTATAIARDLGRSRWLCPNLEKMGLLRPAAVIGTGRRKVRLYPLASDHYAAYRRKPVASQPARG